MMNGRVERAASSSRFGAIILAAIGGINATGCARRDDAAVATGSNSTSQASAEQSPAFALAPDLIAAESYTCDKAEFTTEPDAFIAAVGRTAEHIAADIDIEYPTILRWETLVPPFSDLPGEEPVSVALSYNGSARLYARCQNLVELDMRLALRSESGALSYDGPATLSYASPNGYLARAKISAEEMPEWVEVLQSETVQALSEFTIEIDIGHTGAGRFIVNGPAGAACRLAKWPAQRFCEVGELAVLPEESQLGLRTSDVVARVKEKRTYDIEWDDTGAADELTVDFVPDASGLACVFPAGVGVDGVSQIMYEVPGVVHLSTASGRLDVILPTRASTRGGQSGWTEVELSTPTIVAPTTGFGKVPAELAGAQDRAVLSFNTPRPPITPRSRRFGGGIEVQTVALESERSQPVSGACIASDFFGVTDSVTVSATYVYSEP